MKVQASVKKFAVVARLFAAMVKYLLFAVQSHAINSVKDKQITCNFLVDVL